MTREVDEPDLRQVHRVDGAEHVGELRREPHARRLGQCGCRGGVLDHGSLDVFEQHPGDTVAVAQHGVDPRHRNGGALQGVHDAGFPRDVVRGVQRRAQRWPAGHPAVACLVPDQEREVGLTGAEASQRDVADDRDVRLLEQAARGAEVDHGGHAMAFASARLR